MRDTDENRPAVALLLAVLGVVAGGCSGGAAADAGADAAPDAFSACTTDHDCDDGLYCNGPSACVPGVGCLAGARPCATGQLCSESAHTCTTDCAVAMDADGDGHAAMLCGGDDCDDADPRRYPGSTEVCDAAMHDEDCDPTTFGFRDADADGYADAACCNAGAGGVMHCGTDCNDANANVHPTQAEVCNHVDDDCNGMVDDGITLTWTVDADGDGHGDATPGAASTVGCLMPVGYAAVADDCDDHDAGRHPGLAEICNGVDDDCNGMVDDVGGAGCTCLVGQIQDCGLVGRCMGATQSCMGGTWGPCSIVPIAETCNGIDDDCNGTIDDGLTVTCYTDADNDGYAAAGVLASAQCADTSRMAAPYHGCPTNYTGRAPTSASTVDCCDAESRAHPGQTVAFGTASACTGGGGYDFNCDGTSTSDPLQSGVANCTSASTMSACGSASAGWLTSVPACGGSGTLYGSCMWLGAGACYDTSVAAPFSRQCR